MEIGDIKKVKNKLGIFTIKLVEVIYDNIGNLDGALGKFENLRVEFYKDNWISLYDQEEPEYIYFVEVPIWDDYKPETYKFKIIRDEEPEADFIRLEAE
jgi:hypothetical protein